MGFRSQGRIGDLSPVKLGGGFHSLALATDSMT